MLPSNQRWINKRLRLLPSSSLIIDVGSRDINGAPERVGRYVGVDMLPGPNVDVLCYADVLPFASGVADCVVCADMLEHDATPIRTIEEIYRILKLNGFVVVTAPTIGFKYHPYPKDYWRFTRDSMQLLFEAFDIMELIEDETDHELRLFARKL